MEFEGSILDAVSELHSVLVARGERLAIAESCTGGLVGGALTAIEGASEVFVYDLVAYSNQAKMELLSVPSSTISHTGAVSGPTARAMAVGVRDHLDSAQWGLSITGLAGPGGGRPGKPVGTVYIALASRGVDGTRSIAKRFRFDGDRASIRQQSVRAAIELAVTVIDQTPASPNRSA